MYVDVCTMWYSYLLLPSPPSPSATKRYDTQARILPLCQDAFMRKEQEGGGRKQREHYYYPWRLSIAGPVVVWWWWGGGRKEVRSNPHPLCIRGTGKEEGSYCPDWGEGGRGREPRVPSYFCPSYPTSTKYFRVSLSLPCIVGGVGGWGRGGRFDPIVVHYCEINTTIL